MAKEVRIQLTPAQKAKIKAATGKVMAEIRVTSIGKNLAVAPGQKTTSIGGDIESTTLRDQDALRIGEDDAD